MIRLTLGTLAFEKASAEGLPQPIDIPHLENTSPLPQPRTTFFSMLLRDHRRPRANYLHALLGTLALLLIAGCDQGLPRKESMTFTPIAEGITQAKTLTLYEGVPHDLAENFKPGEKPPQPEMVEVGKHLFYATPLTPAAHTVEALRRLCAAEDSYLPYEAKKCGFHADFCMQWKDGNQEYRVIVCFGCDDVSVQGPAGAVLMTLQPSAVQQLTALLNPLRRNHREATR